MRDKSILNFINKWRSELMGIAILWVALFHSNIALPYGLSVIKEIGYGGVDIFLLLSGCGIYYSLCKSRDTVSFYKRRIKRIMPAYVPFILLWCGYKLSHFLLEPIEAIRVVVGNLCMTGWINDVQYQFNWYVQLICILYFLAPMFYDLIRACKKSWQYIVLFVISVVAGIPFFCDLTHLMGVSRIPIFLLGMIWGHNTCQKENEVGKKSTRVILIIGMILGFAVLLMCIYRYPETLWAYGTWWYPYLLITPGLCYTLSFVFELGERIKVGRVVLFPLKWIGQASFEIYLIHIAAYDLVQQCRGELSNRQWLKLMLAAIVAGIGYHLMIEGLKKLFCKATKSEHVVKKGLQ